MDWLEVRMLDDNVIGPRLFCEFCSAEKALSPCKYCQHFKGNNFKFNELDKKYCRGCGNSP